jgi:copper chaperone NosL
VSVPGAVPPHMRKVAMKSVYERSAQFLHQPVGAGPRGCLILAAVLMAVVTALPLWNLTMFAPQYPDGLRLDIYSHTLVGGNHGQDIKEINVLNHYIGMRDLTVEDFTEFKWMPFAMGGIALLFVRAVVFGTVKELVDAVVVFVYFGGFSLWSFVYKLYRYGHDLAPNAAVKVAGFTPPVFGHEKIANFDIYSFPKAGTYLMLGVVVLLLTGFGMAWRTRSDTA